MNAIALVSKAIPNTIALIINNEYRVFPFFFKEYSNKKNDNNVKK